MKSLLEPKSKKLKKSLNHRQSNHNILKKLENFDGGFWKDEEVTLEASTINHLRQLKRDKADVSIPKQESTKTNVSVLGIIRKYCLSQWKNSTSIFQSFIIFDVEEVPSKQLKNEHDKFKVLKTENRISKPKANFKDC